MRTNEEIKKIALDVLQGRIFCDRMVDAPEMVTSVFMPLGLMEHKDLKALAKRNPQLIFEYLDKAMPMGVNGMPMFTSMQYLDEQEFDVFKDYFEEYKAAMDGVK